MVSQAFISHPSSRCKYQWGECTLLYFCDARVVFIVIIIINNSNDSDSDSDNDSSNSNSYVIIERFSFECAFATLHDWLKKFEPNFSSNQK